MQMNYDAGFADQGSVAGVSRLRAFAPMLAFPALGQLAAIRPRSGTLITRRGISPSVLGTVRLKLLAIRGRGLRTSVCANL